MNGFLPDNSTADGKLYIAHTILFEEGCRPYHAISELTEDGTLWRVFGENSISGAETIDTTGNKIYRVRSINGDKTGGSEEELAFDGHGEIYHCGFNVLGDYLYLKFKELCCEGEYVRWRVTGDTARIHLTDNTIKWLGYE